MSASISGCARRGKFSGGCSWQAVTAEPELQLNSDGEANYGIEWTSSGSNLENLDEIMGLGCGSERANGILCLNPVVYRNEQIYIYFNCPAFRNVIMDC